MVLNTMYFIILNSQCSVKLKLKFFIDDCYMSIEFDSQFLKLIAPLSAAIHDENATLKFLLGLFLSYLFSVLPDTLKTTPIP